MTALFDREALLRGVRALQRPDGSFNSSLEGGENDMRFVFCAAAISRMLEDTECIAMDVDLACRYILNSLSYDGGFGQGPSQEAHGGSTYCAVATLCLTGRLESTLGRKRIDKLLRWCVIRLDDGFSGRPNKPGDTCYSFWVGATIKMLANFEGVEEFIGRSAKFVLETQVRVLYSTPYQSDVIDETNYFQDAIVGGLSKWRDNTPDPLHTYLGLGGLALAGQDGLADFDPALNVTKESLLRPKMKREEQQK